MEKCWKHDGCEVRWNYRGSCPLCVALDVLERQREYSKKLEAQKMPMDRDALVHLLSDYPICRSDSVAPGDSEIAEIRRKVSSIYNKLCVHDSAPIICSDTVLPVEPEEPKP